MKRNDITKPHLKKFFTLIRVVEEPPLNREGFWKKPEFHKAFDVKIKDDK